VLGYHIGTVSNCYNSATVKCTNTNGFGGIIGVNAGTVTRCYYDCQIYPDGGINGIDYINEAEGKLTSFMTRAAAFDGWDDTIWTFTSGLYPRLTGMDTTDAAYVSASPISLEAADTASSVSSNFTVSTANGVGWTSGDSSVVSISGGSATVASSGSVTLTASLNGVSKAVTLTTSHTPTYTVSGTVSAGTTGASVAGRTVQLYSAGTATGYTDETDSDGKFEIAGVPNGTYTAVIAALAGSYAESSSASFEVNGANVTSGADITLAELGGVDYIITNNADGKFIVGDGGAEYTALSGALGACTESGADGKMVIQFGNSGVPLSVPEATDTAFNAL